MVRSAWRWWGATAALVCAVLLVATEALAERRVALVIGNSRYVNAPALTNPSNDAQDMAATLKDLGFDVVSGYDLNQIGMNRVLAEFSRVADGADAAFFFFAGHGLQMKGANYLVPVEASLDDEASVEFGTTPLDHVRRALDRASGVKMLVLDACRNNPVVDRLAKTRSVGETRGLARVDRTDGLLVAYATQAGQVAQDESGRNSPFSAALLRRLREPGLEAVSLFRMVSRDVREMTNGRQVPEFSASSFNEFYLNRNETDVTAWARVSATDDAQALRAFVERYPASPYVRFARLLLDDMDRKAREQQARATAERDRLEADRQATARAEAEAREAERQRQVAAAQARAAEAARKREEEEQRRIAILREEARRREQEDQRRQEIARLETEARQRREAEEAARRRVAEICAREGGELARLERENAVDAIKALRARMVCATLAPSVDETIAALERAARAACQQDVAAVSKADAATLRAIAQRGCETARQRADERLAALEAQRRQDIACRFADERLSMLRLLGAESTTEIERLRGDLSCARLEPMISAALAGIRQDQLREEKPGQEQRALAVTPALAPDPAPAPVPSPILRQKPAPAAPTPPRTVRVAPEVAPAAPRVETSRAPAPTAAPGAAAKPKPFSAGGMAF